LEIIHKVTTIKWLQKFRPGKQCVYRTSDNKYQGWTGYEIFGVIWPFRYFGWRVTCWAQVTAEAYGDAHRARYFDSIANAANELYRLMGIAKILGILKRSPVQYWDPDINSTNKRQRRWFRGDASFLRFPINREEHILIPSGSPASWQRWFHDKPLPPRLSSLVDQMEFG
jgi:hypothetical protein